MKNILFLILIVTTCNACNKVENTNQPTPKLRGNNYRITLLAIENGYCIPPAINCVILPDVVITAVQVRSLEEAETGGANDVGTLFLSESFANIYDNLEDNLGNKLASGDYFIKKNYEDADVVNYLAGTSSSLNFNNFEFVIEFNKE